MLEVKDLTKEYTSGNWNIRKTLAVDHVSFRVEEGEIFGIVGESGCGKTTLSKMIMGLLRPDSGQILYQDRDITYLKSGARRSIRREIQMIYQHPQMTFNPRSTVYNACMEPIRIHKLARDRDEADEMIRNALARVGISDDALKKFPHEISGGQAQRLSIARTLLMRPKLLICDEPTSMLDISVQAQVMSLLKQINREDGLAMLYISHNLDIMEALCSKIAVMKNGVLVECGETREVFEHPQQDYTKRLLAARIEPMTEGKSNAAAE